MDKLVIASMRRGGGKTSIIIGVAKALGKRFGYIKPFGDRLIYREKRSWDYDASLIKDIFQLEDNPEHLSIGFNHSKLRYMYDEDRTRKRLNEIISEISLGRDILFIEGGRDITYGASVYLDAISVSKFISANLYVIISGDDDTILDDISFVKKYVELKNINLTGLIINKIHNLDEFKEIHLRKINDMGIDVVGLIPYQEGLTYFSVHYLAESLFARVICGEDQLDKSVRNIMICDMSADLALKDPLFRKEKKLLITSGERIDLILAALESDTSAVVFTNNILPPHNVISKAQEKKIPFLSVATDTYQVASKLASLEPLLVESDAEAISLLGKLVAEHMDLRKFDLRS